MNKHHARNGLLVATLLFAHPALAQSTMFYGPLGDYEGNASTLGSSTIYYGPMGQYLGNSTTIGNTTSYYGESGSYEGSSYGPAVAAPYAE
jgi:hypothetical protein